MRSWRVGAAVALLVSCARPAASPTTVQDEAPVATPAISDREFWQFFESSSEEGGSFPSENFVSNEQTFQYVIPTLQRTATPGGVYLGVGPEQNFTYIANLKPRMAVIFDIRRQNAMAHLMYKALFEMSATRAEFVSRLFSRPLRPLAISAPADTLFTAAIQAKPSDSAFAVNRDAIIERLTTAHGFALSPEDVQSIKHVLVSFFEAGPDINYGYRYGPTGFGRAFYATYAQLQTLSNADGQNMAFLANEDLYRVVRRMHQRNLIIPVVGDFAGPKAIRSVGAYLHAHDAVVSAFYLSNVEQYLFRQPGDAAAFYRNVAELPLDSGSTFIRSVPRNDAALSTAVSLLAAPAGPSALYNVQVRDSGGVSIVETTTTDSLGRTVTSRRIDSSATPPSAMSIFRSLRARDDSIAAARNDSIRRAGGFLGSRVMMLNGGGSLVSGIASMRRSLDLFNAGQLTSYNQVIAMTKIDGWR